jgi:hypothetical protein
MILQFSTPPSCCGRVSSMPLSLLSATYGKAGDSDAELPKTLRTKSTPCSPVWQRPLCGWRFKTVSGQTLPVPYSGWASWTSFHVVLRFFSALWYDYSMHLFMKRTSPSPFFILNTICGLLHVIQYFVRVPRLSDTPSGVRDVSVLSSCYVRYRILVFFALHARLLANQRFANSPNFESIVRSQSHIEASRAILS